MIDVQFQTKARTIDHLGREQIADCPTAISELWKNAYDAYARNVTLNIYDGDLPVATLCDDGHGMNIDDVINKWLVVGTESKVLGSKVPLEDRNGLKVRPKQGQKGIGRLSCGYLGSLLLLVSKRKHDDFVVALVDWRLFENPYLMLQDITVPVETCKTKENILEVMPNLFDRLMGNVWGDQSDEPRTTRILDAWKRFDSHEKNEAGLFAKSTTREEIEKTIIGQSFEERHLRDWSVWNDSSGSGTALLVGNIDFGLECLLAYDATDSISVGARGKFRETLTGFSDPFTEDDTFLSQFYCSVTAWRGELSREIIGKSTHFSIKDVDHLEHIIKGHVDEKGIFRGQIKAFGNWQDEDVEIILPENLILPKRRDSILGGFEFYIATMEFTPERTSHSREEFELTKKRAEQYSGFMIYRDGLRVMPYGREDSDFFEIEKRRSKRAGTYFWNHRQMFGRIAISKDGNPHLRDKAGREGLVDNRAAKVFKDLVENILETSAKRYFGDHSDIRKDVMPRRKEEYRKKKAAEDRERLRKKNRKNFLKNLNTSLPKQEMLLGGLQTLSVKASQVNETSTEDEVLLLREQLAEMKDKQSELHLSGAPKSLGALEKKFMSYRDNVRCTREMIMTVDAKLADALENISPASPEEIVAADIARHSKSLKRRMSGWNKRINQLLSTETERISSLVSNRNQLFHEQIEGVLLAVKNEKVGLKEALLLIEQEKVRMDQENEELFGPYIEALECLQESIDLQGIASFGTEEVNDLRAEVNRLNELAQLGITVEIVGHELASFDSTIGGGLHDLPAEVKQTRAYQRIKTGYEGLTDKLRFLAPIKVSGERSQDWISGKEIEQFILQFFSDQLVDKQIDFSITDEFSQFRVYDLPARIYPVFINLVNNSIYWVSQTEKNRKIIIDVIGKKVVIGDSGPGVEEQDLKSLFSLFFTRKLRGGRGIGLYLCRSNLAASGHRIEYVREKAEKRLPGANFAISFEGAEYGC